MMKIKRYIFLVAALLLMVQGASAWSGSGNSASDPILIANANDWNTLATNVASGTNYSGKYFKLTADITVTTMVTATFSGTFDGGGHTLTFNYTATGNNAAPFAYITGATIKNLRVAGTINTGCKFAAGIAAECGTTTITNCQSSVTINSSVDGDGTHGGLIGSQSSGTLTINSCLFDGELMGAKTTGCGGFVGWVANNSGYHTYISNSLFAPANITVTAPTFCRHKNSTLHLEASTCYYITPNWTASTVQGTNAGSMTTASLVTALNNGGTNWCNNGGNATPILIFDYIGNQSNWNAFTSGINAGINYSGKTVKMSADFTATTMATSTFSGTFDGGGHTLTFNYTATGNNAAPFAYITGATIKNLRVAGTINTGCKFAAGIAAECGTTTITNCQSSVTINSSVDGDGTHGGLIGHHSSGTLTINSCLFDGELLGASTFGCGGFVGWDKTTTNITNSLFAPTAVSVQGPTFSRTQNSNTLSLTNCYYTDSSIIGNTHGYATQGSDASGMTAEALVAALNNGDKNWCVHRGNAIPVMVNLVINNKTEWDNFSSHAGNYEKKYVQLNADISNITAMTSGTFQGIFDGNGHKLTVDLSGGGNVAPFQYLNGGTIMNLTVAGTVTSTDYFCSGLVARTSGGVCLIDNCVVNTNNDGVGFVGGVLAHADNATALTISNCIYGGTIAIQESNKNNYSGGILGWYNRDNHTLDLTMTNCLCKGTYNGNGTFHPIGVKKSGYSIDTSKCHDCYYTTNPHNNPGSDRYVYAGTKVSELTIGTTGVSIASGSYATFQGTKYYYGTVTLGYNGPMATTNFSLDGTHLNDNSFTISTDNAAFDDGTATIKWDFPGRGTVGDPYQISSAAVWNFLADEVDTGNNNYEGKYFRQTGDFTITRMVGAADNADDSNYNDEVFRTFNGTYDGYGHILNLNLDVTGERYVGPFHCVSGATIKNLKVTGSVQVHKNTNGAASIHHPSALIGCARGTGQVTIVNCLVSASVGTAEYMGGLIGNSWNANVTIEGCAYTGTLTATGTNYTGGLIGWGGDNGNCTFNLTNNIFAGTYSGNGKFHPVGVLNGSSANTRTVTNTYYTVEPKNMTNDQNHELSNQGKLAYSILAGNDVTISGLGTATSTYEHNVITVYSHGIKYNINSTDYYYAGGDEVVSLNLAHGSKTGYTFSNYEVSGGGSLTNIDATSATLTMSAANQTIDAQWTENVATLNETANALDELKAMSGKQTKVTFTRSGLTANSYSTMCLPFDFTAPSGCTFYAFTGVEWSTTNDQWEATITEQASATTLSAHTPYIFKCTGTSATFTNNAVIAASSYDNALVEVGATSGTDQAWKFKGTYTPLSWASADPTEPTYGFSTYVPNETIAAGTFVRFVKGASLAPFRARLIYSGTDTHLNAPRRAGANELPVIIIVRIIGINGETTSIGTLDTRTGEVTTDGWYTLGGMKLKGQPNQQGIYIHNGRKEVIR